jgi:hypothetical protein
MSQSVENQDIKIKEMFLETFSELYGNLVKFLNKMPLNHHLKSHCFMNFDQGAFWARECIAHMKFEVKPEDAPQTNPESVIPDSNIEEKKEENNPTKNE